MGNGSRARRFSFRNSGRARRPMDWEAGSFDGSVVAGTPVCEWIVLPSDINENYTDPTLMYTSVELQVRHENATAGDLIALGIISWNYVDPDTDAVPMPCPDPAAQPDLDWVYLWTLPLVTATGTFISGNSNGPERHIESKARRRLGNDRSLLAVIGTIGINAEFHLHARCLLKE